MLTSASQTVAKNVETTNFKNYICNNTSIIISEKEQTFFREHVAPMKIYFVNT